MTTEQRPKNRRWEDKNLDKVREDTRERVRRYRARKKAEQDNQVDSVPDAAALVERYVGFLSGRLYQALHVTDESFGDLTVEEVDANIQTIEARVRANGVSLSVHRDRIGRFTTFELQEDL